MRLLLLIILLGIGWFAYDRMDTVNQSETANHGTRWKYRHLPLLHPLQRPAAMKPTTGRLTYSNTTYGFEVEYPSYIRLENDFYVIP